MTKTSKNPLYFIAIIPPLEVDSQIEEFKKEIQNNFGIKHALKLQAHITLQIPFRMPENKEPALIKKLQNFFETQESISAHLDGFGRFGKNVIFVKIKEHDLFIKLHAALQEVILDFIDLKSHEISSRIHPHITLATRDLKRSHFPEIWEFFNSKSYSVPVSFNKIVLFKHNDTIWIPIKSFDLAPN